MPAEHRKALSEALERAGQLAGTVAANSETEIESRHATTMLYHAATAALMSWEGAQISAQRGDARRLLWSKLILDHKLKPRDPFERSDTASEARIASMLLRKDAVPLSQLAELL